MREEELSKLQMAEQAEKASSEVKTITDLMKSIVHLENKQKAAPAQPLPSADNNRQQP
mgnify:CR=1 FL=1